MPYFAPNGDIELDPRKRLWTRITQSNKWLVHYDLPGYEMAFKTASMWNPANETEFGSGNMLAIGSIGSAFDAAAVETDPELHYNTKVSLVAPNDSLAFFGDSVDYYYDRADLNASLTKWPQLQFNGGDTDKSNQSYIGLLNDVVGSIFLPFDPLNANPHHDFRPQSLYKTGLYKYGMAESSICWFGGLNVRVETSSSNISDVFGVKRLSGLKWPLHTKNLPVNLTALPDDFDDDAIEWPLGSAPNNVGYAEWPAVLKTNVQAVDARDWFAIMIGGVLGVNLHPSEITIGSPLALDDAGLTQITVSGVGSNVIGSKTFIYRRLDLNAALTSIVINQTVGVKYTADFLADIAFTLSGEPVESIGYVRLYEKDFEYQAMVVGDVPLNPTWDNLMFYKGLTIQYLA